MISEHHDNVWDALCDTPEQAVNMTLRSELMLRLRARIEAWGLTQDEAAGRLGLTRPRLSDLMRGKIDKFSLDALVTIAASAGFEPRIELRDAA